MKELNGIRAEILRIFFTNPEKSYYMNEIGRMLDKKPGVFQRTINNLEREGILISEYKANARFFTINKNYPLFNELKSMIFKTIGVLGSIKNILNKHPKIKYAFIYGSYAKGKENYLSDIDVIIIGECNEDNLINDFNKMENILKREINFKLYSFKNFNKYIINNDPFLLGILTEPKLMLIGEENELRKISERKSNKKTNT